MKRQSINGGMGAMIIAGSIVVLTAASAEAKYTDHTGATPPDHAWFGVIAKDARAPADKIHHAARDVRLEKVFRSGPAYAAGARPGDVVWKFDGVRMHSAAQLKREIRSEKPGKTVPVEIFHHGKLEGLKVALGSHHPSSTPQPTQRTRPT